MTDRELLEQIDRKLDRLLAQQTAKGGASAASANGGAVFPRYGRSKGQPIKGASENDLTYYRNGALRSLADESKSRFHDQERALLAAIEAEMTAQGIAYEKPAPDDGSSIPF